jgi:hypothetical protein
MIPKSIAVSRESPRENARTGKEGLVSMGM